MKHLGKFALAAVLAGTVAMPAYAQLGVNVGGSASGSGTTGSGAGVGANTGIGADVGIGGGTGANVGINSNTRAGVNGSTGATGSANTDSNTNVGADTTTPRSTIGTTTNGAARATGRANASANGMMNFDQYSTYLNRTATAGAYATNDIRTRFNSLDTNNDNFVSQAELTAGAKLGVGTRTN